MRGVTAARTGATTSSSPAMGNGMAATTTRAPVRDGHELQRLPAGGVDVGGGEQLVAGARGQGAQDGVDAGRRVRDEGEVVRVRAEEGAESGTCLGEAGRQAAPEEVDRLALQLGAQRGLLLEDGRSGRRRTSRG